MITQSTVLPRGTAIDLCPAPPQPTVANGSWSGLGVVIQSGVIPFLQSLHPGFLPSPPQSHGQWAEGPAFTIGSGGQDHGFLLGTELAARLVSACAALPAEVGSLLGGFASLCAGVRLAKDQLGAGGAATGSPPVPDWVDNRMDGSPTNDKDKASKTQRKWRELTSPPITAPGQSGLLAKAAVALGALSGLTAAGAEVLPDKRFNQWIEVADAATLGKIGHDPDYPRNGAYRQTADIDGGGLSGSIGNGSYPFTGRYDGQCHTIENLRHCLMSSVEEEGHLDNLRFTGANIQSSDTAGVAACAISDKAMVSNILVESAYVSTGKSEAGIAVGYVDVGGTVVNTTAVNCVVKTSGEEDYTPAGIGAGLVRGTVANTTAVNCMVKTSGRNKASAGIGAGLVESGGSVGNTIAVNCTVKTLNRKAQGGIGAGHVDHGSVGNTTALNCTVQTFGAGSNAAIGAGNVGYGSVSSTTAVSCTVATKGGVGAGIGAGRVEEGNVGNTIAVGCMVEASKGDAGIGAGLIVRGTVGNTTGINCTVEAFRQGAKALINGGDNPRICNVRINGATIPENANNSDCTQLLDDLCENTAHQLLSSDCQPLPLSPDGLDSINIASNNYCPVSPKTTHLVPYSSPPAVTMALPTTAAPLAATLSTGAITGIALGAVGFVLAGVVGVCIYRHYHSGPSPVVTSDQKELSSIFRKGLTADKEDK